MSNGDSNTAGFDPPGSDAMDAPAQQPHSNAPAGNGAGGPPATHQGHADKVPDGGSAVGKGAEDDRSNQTRGNQAAKNSYGGQ